MSPLGISATFPMVRFASAARRVAPIEGPSRFTLALESIGSGTGQLVEDPWVESSTPGNLYEPDDILYGKLRPYLAKVWVADRAGNYVGDFIRITARSSFDSQFLKYVILTPSFISEASAGSVGSKMPRTEWDTLKQIQIPAPRLEQQQQIADYLDHETAEIDAFIADQTIFKKLVTEYFHSFLTEIYASRTLSTRRLKDFGVTKVSGVSVNGSSEPARDSELGVLKTGSVSKGYFDASENKAVLDPAEMERLKTPVRAGHLIVNRANTPDLVGSLAPVFHDFPHLFLSDLLWQLKFKKVDPNYIYWYSKTRKFRDQISLIKVGASQTMQKIRFEDFARLEIPFMSFEDQRSILTKASEEGARVQQVVRLVGQAIDLARKRRAALITAAVTGQIDVTAKNKPAAEQLEDDIAQGLHREYA